MEQLVEEVREHRAILFVGSGVSAGLGLPTASALVDLLAEDLDYEPDIFRRLGDFSTLAEYYTLQHGGSIGQLRSKLDVAWHGSKVDIGASRIHQAIVELGFPWIYTTNYDRWLERAFDHAKTDYLKVVNVGDLRKEKPGLTQIVKFHGDFDDDASIVLTDTSYMARLEFDSPLDIKLRSDTLGRTILFLGYSLSDINLRYLLYKLTILWKSSGYPAARPQSYIVLPRPNAVQEAVLASRGVRAIVQDADDEEKGLETFLEGLLLDALGKTL